MTIGIAESTATGAGHAVQFYTHDAQLRASVGGYLAEAIRAGATAIVIATESHQRMFDAELAAAGIDADCARSAGALRSLDAASTIATYYSGGIVDGAAFRRVIGALLQEARDSGRPIRAYGEMVALLWEAGDVLAAVEVERLWNELAEEFEFMLLCAYRSDSVAGAEHSSSLREVCHLHTSVTHLPVSRQFALDADAPCGARGFLSETLRGWGHDGLLLSDAELVLSELATNAVLHAHSSFTVSVSSEFGRIRICVHDRSRRRPQLRDRDRSAASGFGLQLIEVLASRWGVEVDADGKTVWAELEPRGGVPCSGHNGEALAGARRAA
jgi:anti-sigma regulatory factor (Ser/Thr protein kinase)